MKNDTMTLTFGSDPEMMLLDKNQNDFVSAIDVLKRGKEDKIDLGDGFNFYYDNVLLEANVPPSTSKDETVHNFRNLFSRIKDVLGKDMTIVPRASHTFAEKECQSEEARIFGCNPEFCAYEMRICFPPDCTNTFRSAGGHIHVGRTDFENASDDFLLNPRSKCDVIKMMDLFVGLPLTMVDNDPSSPARKKLYGIAGRHRPTPYGVEYRTPCNYWLSNPKLTELIYDLTNFVLNREDKYSEDLEICNSSEVISAINTNDKKLAAQLLDKLPLDKSLKNRVAKLVNNTYNTDLYKSWGI